MATADQCRDGNRLQRHCAAVLHDRCAGGAGDQRVRLVPGRVQAAILGAGTIPVTWTKAITEAFDRQRGLALGLALSGTGLCGVLMPQYTTYLVETWGWRTAYVGIGLAPLLIGLPVAWWGFRSVQEQSGPAAVPLDHLAVGMTLREAAGSRAFWVVLLSIFVVYMAASGIGPNLCRSPTPA
ncbi:MAG: MFS transporter [Pseudomonadales bacterium]